MVSGTNSSWQELAMRLEHADGAFIDGRYEPATSGATFETTNPATEEVLAKVAACDVVDVDRAVAAARRSFDSGVWSRCAPSTRRETLLRLADLIELNADELALTESLDTGKKVADALSIDVAGSAAVMRFYAEAIDKISDEVAPTGPGDIALVTREPLGVVGAVVPWNFPLEIAIWKIAPALAMGNSVVLKPAEESPLTALRLGRLAHDAGVPAGVFNVVPGFGATAGRALGLNPDVDCVTFTGSTEVGRLFLQYSAESNIKQVWLECGGKSPNIVFADAPNLERVAELACLGAFGNQGEVCSANSRILVQRQVYDRLVDLLAQKAGAFAPGDPLDHASGIGSLISAAHRDRVLSYIDIGRNEGRVICGGKRVGETGSFVEPTVIADLHPGSRVVREEIFGPVLVVLPFDHESEAIQIANDSPYGLAASVWTRDLDRTHRIASRLHVGTVSVNTVDALSPTTPFGGFKQSGFGRDLSLHALDNYSGLKTTWIKYDTQQPAEQGA